jgi:hypothetical protein
MASDAAADEPDVERRTPISEDAAIVLGLACTAMPFAGSIQAEAERWLRVLRLYGQVGRVLQTLGVGEAPLETTADPDGVRRRKREPGDDPVEMVTAYAYEAAEHRCAELIGTVDVLFGVLRVYGRDFDRALYVRGTSRDELLSELVQVPRLAGI